MTIVRRSRRTVRSRPSSNDVSTSRRDFLKAAAGTAGAAAVSRLAAGSPVHAQGSEAIKIGLIGCGDRGTGAAIQALGADPGVRLIAAADIFRDRLEGSLAQIKSQRPGGFAVDKDHGFVGFDGYRKVLESGVDAVLIACATRFHPTYLKAGIDAGKHVFVEKPHAIDPAGVRVVLEACEAAKRKRLCVISGLHRRYDPAVKETIARVHDGAIGELVSLEVSFMRAPYKIVPKDPAWSEIEYQFRNWYHFRWLSGDDVPQSLIHTLDIGTWALGEKTPAAIHGLAGRSASFGNEYGDVFDHHAVVFQYASGANMYGLLRTQHNCHGEVEVKLQGTKGRAAEGWIDGETKWRYEGPNAGGHQQEQTDFMAMLREGKVANNGDYMARSTLLGIIGQLACYTGKRITWDEALKSTYAYPPAEGPVDFTTDPPVKPGADGQYPVPVPGKTAMA
jgi:predicted dehydrogenase